MPIVDELRELPLQPVELGVRLGGERGVAFAFLLLFLLYPCTVDLVAELRPLLSRQTRLIPVRIRYIR